MRSNFVVLISGSGSNLQSLIDASQQDDSSFTIGAVISNVPAAYGLKRAQSANIEAIAIDHKAFPSREAFDQQLVETLKTLNPDGVILAGFMRILTPSFIQAFEDRILNIHPSLLPKYPGLHTHKRALQAGDSEAGCSVHFVTEALDGGPLIAQASVPVERNDTPDTLAARVLTEEHKLYPAVAQWFGEGRLRLRDNVAELDGQPVQL